MGKKPSKSQQKVSRAFREVNKDEPAQVAKTRKKYGAARAKKQKTAIALSKARRAGARIPKR